MNNPNPFVPKGSLLEQQSQRRSRLKLGVFCVLAVSITGLVAMLIQGCKRDQPPADAGTPPPDMSSNSLAVDNSSNTPPMDVSTNLTMSAPSNSVVMPPPAPVVVPPPVVDVAPAPGTEYIVVAGDTLGKIAHRNHVSLKDLETANPGVDSKHLKIKQKLTIPVSTQSASAAPGGVGMTDDSGDVYVVKSGDTLMAIAKKHGTTVKAIQAANNLATTKIKVNQKLKLPAKADAAAAVPADTAPAPMVPAPAAPAPMQLPPPSPAPTK